MKRILSLIMIIVTLLTLLAGCSILPDELKTCKVKFYVDGELYDTKTVVVGQSVGAPKNPSKNNQIFLAWSTGGIIPYEYDFTSKVIMNMELHAYFTIDAVGMANMITKETIKSIVTIENKCYNTTVGGIVNESDMGISQGSGVVVDISGGYCYVLTNNHVVKKAQGYSKQSFTVEDPWGETYEAQIYKCPGKTQYAMSEEYDLALIYFRYDQNQKYALKEIAFSSDPDEGDFVAAIGTPAGLQNTVTYGSVLNYERIKADEDSSLQKVTFDVILHDAPIDHGSSGGALIDTDGKLVGINFAGYGDGTYGCSIPISKINEFMNKYVY